MEYNTKNHVSVSQISHMTIQLVTLQNVGIDLTKRYFSPLGKVARPAFLRRHIKCVSFESHREKRKQRKKYYRHPKSFSTYVSNLVHGVNNGVEIESVTKFFLSCPLHKI